MAKWPYPQIAAHRGGGKLAPENTLAAIDTGVKYGHTMIEFDVKLSHDNVPFLLHDDTLERTSNAWGVAGALPWEILRNVDAGSWFASAFKGEGLALLSDVAARCRQHQLYANVEIKPTTGQERETGLHVARAVDALWQGMATPLLSSFSITALEAAQEAAPELPRGLLLDAWREDWQAVARQLGCVSLHLNYHLLDEARVQAIKAAGFHILVYTVNAPQRARQLLAWGVDTLCTDKINVIGPNFMV